MPTSVLTAATAAGTSTDITVTDRTTVSLYRAVDDYLELEGGGTDDILLLEDATELLLEQQVGDGPSPDTLVEIKIKDSLGGYNPTGWFLRSDIPIRVLPPGVYQAVKNATTALVGVQIDASS